MDVIVHRRQGAGTPFGGGARGAIVALSEASRRRLVHTARNVEALPLHLVLTYPAEFPMDGRTVKGHWSQLRKRMARRGLRGLWWLEFQRRGAPHIHAAVDGPGTAEIQRLREWVARAWYDIVSSGDERHLHAGTYLDPWRSGRYGLQDYVAKEAAKWVQKEPPEGFAHVGRFWGLFGGVRLARRVVEAEAASLVPTERVARAAERALRRQNGYRPRRDRGSVGFTAYGAAGAVSRWLAEEGLAGP